MYELTIKQKLTNYCYFVIFNSILACIIGFFYFCSPWQYIKPSLIFPNYVLFFIFTLTSHISTIILFGFVVGATVLPTIFLPQLARMIIQSIIAAISLIILFIDTHLFFSEGIHFIDVFTFRSSSYFSLGSMGTLDLDIYVRYLKIIFIVCATIIELLLLIWLNKTSWLSKYKIGRKFILTASLFGIISYTMYFTGSCLRKEYIANNVVHLPWFTNNKINNSSSWQHLDQYKDNLEINYPLKPLITTQSDNSPVNILVIGIDAWHYDYFNENTCPNLWQFAQQGTNFTRHMSGANFTRKGLFSLFYGIPTTYWYSFLKQKQSPIIIDRLQQLNYQFGIFVSNQLKHDMLDKTVFSKITNLRLETAGVTPVEKDSTTTNDWFDWFNNIDTSKPFFSFVFYYSVHEHDFPVEFDTKSIPTSGKLKYADIIKQQGMEGFKQGYQTSIRYIDSLANKIITKLKQLNLLENTIVIITADHGSELNDYDQHHYGHGSNFSDCQLHVPFVIVGPKFKNKNINTLTTHYDVVPTLMKNFLGVTNNITDYSTGFDLLDASSSRHNWYLACNSRGSSINSIGIITKKYCTQYFPSGKFNLVSTKNIPLKTKSFINNNYLSKAVEMMTRFIKK